MARLLAEHLARELRKDRRHYLILQSITDIFEKVFQISKKNTPADLEHLRAIKIEVRGKIKGSERKRKYTQTLISNELPLLNHTATVDMAMASTDTVYGALGIKV
jgi:ribosomal protein S3